MMAFYTAAMTSLEDRRRPMKHIKTANRAMPRGIRSIAGSN